jgi:hypothetical protein
MKPFTDNKDDNQSGDQTIKGRFAERVDILKHQLANFLGRQSQKLSLHQQKRILLLAGVLMGGISLALIIRPFQDSTTPAFNIPEGMNAKAFIIQPRERDAMIAEEDYLMLLKFKSTLDSLYKTNRPVYDEVLQGHAGLLDSINFLISIYSNRR